MLNAQDIEYRFSGLLALPIKVAVFTAQDSLPALTDAELAKFATLTNDRARQSWCAGRSALKLLLQHAQQPVDTCALRFPNAHYSLSHSRGTAIAVLSTSANGIGIDLEFDRSINPGIRKFFLNEQELRHETAHALTDDDLLRLWTVKEAIYKSDLQNKEQLLARYTVASLNSQSGTARRGNFQFNYASIRQGGAWISIAVAGPLP